MIQLKPKHTHFVLRTIQEKDLPGLKKLVASIKDGLTSLPNNKAFLSEKIDKAVHAFNHNVTKPQKEHYLFVLEDLKTNTIAGVSGIYANAGCGDPLLSFRVTYENVRYKPLGIYKELKVLQLEEDTKPTSEICSLYMHPKYRKSQQGRLLTLSRYLYIAAFPKRFHKNILAELRGFRTTQGISQFWQSVSKPFFNMPLKEAEVLRATQNRGFIQSILPNYPIHVCMLPPAARVLIGRVHRNTRPALHLLESEGFKKTNQVDVLDAGPFLAAKLKDIRTYKESNTAIVSKIVPNVHTRTNQIICNNRKDFRACIGNIQVNKDKTITLSEHVAKTLEVNIDDKIRFVKERSNKK